MPAGTLVRTRTIVGRPKAKKGRYLKNTTRRGAYKKKNKAKFQKRLVPFLETKSKTSEDLVDLFGMPQTTTFNSFVTSHAHINPNVFLLWSQGVEENQCLGRSVYVRYLKRKITIRFPQTPFTIPGTANKQIPNVPQHYELIWGFVPMPLNLTSHTTPTVYDATSSDINSFINKRVSDYLNDNEDYLRFIPKKAATIKIIGRRHVKPNMNANAGLPPQLDSMDDVTGNIPDYNTSIYWPMKRKIHLEKSNALHDETSGFYPNFTWLPFCVLHNRNYELLPAGSEAAYVPSLAYNDCIWYQDS